MGKKTTKGASDYGKNTPTADITADLEKHPEIETPGALAAWIRRKSLGMSKSEFAKYGARMKREGK
jgi:hypothetical protein